MIHKSAQFGIVPVLGKSALFALHRARVQASPGKKHTGRYLGTPSFRIYRSHLGQRRSAGATAFTVSHIVKAYSSLPSTGPESKPGIYFTNTI